MTSTLVLADSKHTPSSKWLITTTFVITCWLECIMGCCSLWYIEMRGELKNMEVRIVCTSFKSSQGEPSFLQSGGQPHCWSIPSPTCWVTLQTWATHREKSHIQIGAFRFHVVCIHFLINTCQKDGCVLLR